MKKSIKLLLVIISAVVLLSLISCSENEKISDESESESESEISAPTDIIIAKTGEEPVFSIAYNTHANALNANVYRLVEDEIYEKTGVKLTVNDDFVEELQPDCEVVINSKYREDSRNISADFAEGDWAIKTCIHDDGKMKVVLCSNGYLALKKVVNTFIDNYVSDGIVSVPADLDLSGHIELSDILIQTDIPVMRDPCILVDDDGTLYCYGTPWYGYKNTTGDLANGWEKIENLMVVPEDYADCPWAPEVYKIDGEYYMITTYKSKTTERRGCAIFKSSSPEGPFVQYSDGFVTPAAWDSIDGTLYYQDGVPYMVFSHELTSPEGDGGSFVVAQLSDDLTHLVTEPVTLFYASKADSETQGISDGCFMYTTEDGHLLMLWSDGYSGGYSILISEESSGDVYGGKWKFHDGGLYTTSTLDYLSGGHGMVFEYNDQLYCTFHISGDVPVILKIKEKDNNLVVDFGD